MKKTSWLNRLSGQLPAPTMAQRIGGSMGVAAFLMTAAIAAAQAPAPEPQLVAPSGYSIHEAIDLGGRMANMTGSGAMYDTMINLQSGPRVLGETFQLRALPGTKSTLVDSLTAVSNGFGGDPNNFSSLDFYKGNLYEFSGLFRRDRQYFDYDLLGNPNIISGLSTPIGSAIAPAGSLPWSQVNQSPFLFNTVRRMTDTSVTIFPLSKVTFRAGYSQNVFQGPSLTPSGYQFAGSYSVLVEEFQRKSADDFLGGIDWKVLPQTRLTFEEEVDHYKENSYFTMPPGAFNVQEADGTKAALLANYYNETPYTNSSCNANSAGSAPVLSAPPTPGGLPIVNPACAVVTSYQRSQPTRMLFPTEIFRFQSSSITNVSMNGDVRYTNANMSLPNYYENFQGLTKTTRSLAYTAFASAQRKVIDVDYGIVWQASQKFSLSDQVSFWNVQQPGVATMTSVTTVSTPATAGNETINASNLTASIGALGSSTFEGSGSVGDPLPYFFGQKYVNNDVTGTWEGWSLATLSLTYRHRTHIIAEGLPHSAPLTYGETDGGTVTIHQNGGILNLALRPTARWDVNGTAEILYADNAFTPVAPRQLQRYRVHTMYRPRTWATITGAFNDMELHNNTNNSGAVSIDGPLDHVAHSRIGSVGATLAPNAHYALSMNYAYSDIYTATNICYNAASTPTLPGAATPSGTACPGATVRGAKYYEFGPARDFMDAPTQYGSAAITVTPVSRLQSSIGYLISSVSGSRFYNDARDVAGSLVSTYQSPYVNLAWTVHPSWIWKAEYNFYGYGEGGPSGAPYCSTSNPTPGSPVPVVPCNSPVLAGLQTGLTISPAGETAPRNFHANNVTLGFHYEF